MPLFRIGVIERYERTYTIEAEDEAHAIELAATQSSDDEGELFEYHSTTPSDMWNVTPVEAEATEYRVTWEIEVTADSPQEAARIALDMQREQTSEATYFRCVGGGETWQGWADLSEDDPRNNPELARRLAE